MKIQNQEKTKEYNVLSTTLRRVDTFAISATVSTSVTISVTVFDHPWY